MHSCTVQTEGEVEPVRGTLFRRVDEVPDRARRVVKPRPRGDAAPGRECEHGVCATRDVDLGVYELGARQRPRGELRVPSSAQMGPPRTTRRQDTHHVLVRDHPPVYRRRDV